MVQSNLDGRSRVRRTRQSEEQAPLVESYLSGNSSTIYHGKKYSLMSHSMLSLQKCDWNANQMSELSITGCTGFKILYSTSKIKKTLKLECHIHSQGDLALFQAVLLTCEYRLKLLKQSGS